MSIDPRYTGIAVTAIATLLLERAVPFTQAADRTGGSRPAVERGDLLLSVKHGAIPMSDEKAEKVVRIRDQHGKGIKDVLIEVGFASSRDKLSFRTDSAGRAQIKTSSGAGLSIDSDLFFLSALNCDFGFPVDVVIWRKDARPTPGEKGRSPTPPVAKPRQEQLERLLADLASDSFAMRQHAEAELERIGEQAAPALRKHLKGEPPLEVRLRIERVLKKVTLPGGEGLRPLLMVRHGGREASGEKAERVVRVADQDGKGMAHAWVAVAKNRRGRSLWTDKEGLAPINVDGWTWISVYAEGIAVELTGTAAKLPIDITMSPGRPASPE